MLKQNVAALLRLASDDYIKAGSQQWTQTEVMGKFFPTGKTEAYVEADLDAALVEIAELQSRIQANQNRTAQAAEQTRAALTHLESLLADTAERFTK